MVRALQHRRAACLGCPAAFVKALIEKKSPKNDKEQTNKQKKREKKGKAVRMPSPPAALTVSLCSCLREAKSPKHTHRANPETERS